ncbi:MULTISPECIES: isochorismate synthase [Bacillus]|uniref:isochorismate synthase n=1 Tax=Bacillus TaxID=1386 RepID=UPI000BB70A21|nr:MULTISPECIES: isochorismate synthase [Bacillus]
MVIIQANEWIQLLKQVDKNKDKPVLISFTKKIKNVDPLQFFRESESHFYNERFFWTNPERSTYIIGAGVTKEFQSSGKENRYKEIEDSWKRFLQDGIINDTCTTPLLFGGFSFDPIKKKTNLWNSFSDSIFVLPTFMLTIKEDQCFITINILNDISKDDIDLLKRIEEKLLSTSMTKELEVLPSLVSYEELEPEMWKESIRDVTRRISNQEMEKVVLARELRVGYSHKIPLSKVTENLLEEQQNSYVFAFARNGDCFIGATPEQLVKKNEEDIISMCLAGSTKRGQTLQEDEQLGKELLTDEKNLHEHHLVVKMIRDSLQSVCAKVETDDSPSLRKLKHIQHLYTPVKATGDGNTSLLQLVERLHPTPALGGYPTEIAIKTIREVELLDRGWYASPIGFVDSNNNGEFAVAIRSGLIQEKEASLFAGCGIVGDSDPDSEYEETKVKFKPMLSALGGINLNERNN